MDYFVVFLIVFAFPTSDVSASQSKYTTDLCPGTVGPVHGVMFMFDPQQRDRNETASWYIPEKDLDCWVTLRGQPSTKAQYMLELRFKGSFSVKGYGYGTTGKMPTNGNVTGTDCETGYMEIYEATEAGVPYPTRKRGPLCGSSPPATLRTEAPSLLIHVFVAAVPEYLLPTTPAPTTIADTGAGLVTVAGTGDNMTTMTPTTTTIATTPRPPTLYEQCLSIDKCPYMKFYADFTSYIPSGCYEDGVLNDDDQIYCLTGRCIHISLLCDVTNSNNCGDWSDQVGSACIRPTLPPQPPPEVDYTWVYALVAGLLGLFAVLYCCWRPGYIPWRLARLRNIQMGPCGKLGRCCRSRRGQGACGGCGCCGPTTGWLRSCLSCCCIQTESRYPDHPPNPDKVRKPPLGRRILASSLCMRRNGVEDGDLDVDNLPHRKSRGLNGGPWINYAFDDGMHVREIR